MKPYELNPYEALRIAEVVVGVTAGLAAAYYGGRNIFYGLRAWHQDCYDVFSALPSTPVQPANIIRSSQMSKRDQRPNILQPPSNRGQRSARKHPRNSRRF